MNYIINRIDCCDSTNDELKKNSKNLDNGYVLIADRQTKGRGTKGRSFVSPMGNLYMSILFKSPIFNTSKAPFIAASAVNKTINELYNINSKIKWINDIYINDKKVCGILCESKYIDHNVQHLIMGIGVNILDSPIQGVSTSIKEHYNNPNKEIFIKALLNNINHFIRKDCMVYYRNHNLLINKSIIINNLYMATVLDIDRNGHLIIKKADGKIITLSSADIDLIK